MSRKILMALAIPAVAVAARVLLDRLVGQPLLEQSSAPTPRPVGDDAPLGGTISEELLNILVCPEDKGELEVVDDGRYLLNPRNGYRYPIRDGIPIMLIEEGRANRVPV